MLGHNLSATVAPRLGKADPSIAGLIIAGGAALPILDHFVPQAMVEFAAKGPMTRADERQLERLKAQVARAQDPDLKPDTPRTCLSGFQPVIGLICGVTIRIRSRLG